MNNITKDFELKETEAAIALDKDWSVSIYFPTMGEEDIVPDHVLLLTKIGVLLRDESFVNYVFDHAWPEGANPYEEKPDERSGDGTKEQGV